jgi:hypothetical protein
MKRRDVMSLPMAAGELMRCGLNCSDRWHGAASFERVFKLGAAKTLGLPMPQPLRRRADRVIR